MPKETHPIMLRKRQLAPRQEAQIRKLIERGGNLLQVELVAKCAFKDNEIVFVDDQGKMWEEVK